MARAAGFCSLQDCENRNSGAFLLDHTQPFYCPRCRYRGWVEPEVRRDNAPADAVEPVYKEVRTHFNFDPSTRKYKETAIVRIPELSQGWSFDIYSPLTHTEKRALMMAETTLCWLNSGERTGESRDVVLDVTHEDWPKQLKRLEAVLADRDRRLHAQR